MEELTREGEEPKLTAEALAERIGESLRTDDEIQGVAARRRLR